MRLLGYSSPFSVEQDERCETVGIRDLKDSMALWLLF